MEAYLVWTSVSLILLLMVIQWWRRNRNIPPGPWGIPYFGYYPFLGESAWLNFYQQSKTYGSVLSFRTVGGKLVIILNGLDVIKEVLHTRAEEFGGRPHEEALLTWVSNGLGIAQEEGLPWKEQRHFFISKAKDFGFGKTEAEDHIHELVQQMVRDIKDTKGKPFKLFPHISHVSTNVIGEILFKQQLRKDDPTFLRIANGLHSMAIIFNGNTGFLLGPHMKYYLLKCTSDGRLSEKIKNEMLSMVRDIVDEHLRTFDPCHLRDYVDAYLNHMKNLEATGKLYGSSFTRKRLEAVAFNMWFEGTESVTAAICSLLLAIAKYPDVQKKVQVELDSVIGKDRQLSWLDKPNLTYFDAVLSELFRKYQPFWVSQMYSNFEETTIRGYTIPKRSRVVANFYSINYDPKMHPNPEKFDPDRFLGPEKKRLKQEGISSFGIGKRGCAGEPLAQMELFVIIGSILQHFTLYPVGEDTVQAVARTDS